MEQPPHPMRLGDEHDYYAQRTRTARGRPRPEQARPAASAAPHVRGGGPGDRRAGRDRRRARVVIARAGGRAAAPADRSGGELIAFWILAPLALLGAVGMVFSRVAVHSALWLVLTMLCLGCLYIAQNAEFLGFVQIIVYTGAIMMLFLFVLMLTGRDAGDSTFEVLQKQRIIATVARHRRS